jgi:hypothetical protein
MGYGKARLAKIRLTENGPFFGPCGSCGPLAVLAKINPEVLLIRENIDDEA